MQRNHVFKPTILSGAILLAMAPTLAAQSSSPADNLEEVVVQGVKQPYRGDMPLESLPQQVQVISADLLTDLGVIELQNALDLAGGVARQNTFGGLWDSFAIRGFAGDENVPSGYLINGFSGGRGFSGRRDSSNIENIEVLKGPGSALYGRGEPGGTINLVTKKPQFETEGYIKASAGRFSTYRLEGDYTTALSEQLAFRINGGFDDADSYRHTVESQKLSITPSILYLPSDRTALSYEMEYLDQEAPFDRGIIAVDGDPEVMPISNFYGEPGDGPIQIKATGHQFLAQHELNSDWSVLAGLGYRQSSFEGCATQAELAGSRQLFYVDGQTLSRQRTCRDYDADDLSGRIELSGNFETGSLKHHLLIGLDAYDYELESIQNRFRPAPGSLELTIDAYNPVYGQPLPTDLSPLNDQLDEQSAVGVYFQDQIDISPRWQLLLGMRYDDFEQDFTNRLRETAISQSDTQLSPRAGLVFEASENLTLYASYSEGFRPNSGTNFAGSAFEPESSESYEAGVKWRTMDGNLTGTVALFKAKKSNILTADPTNIGFSEALGAADSEGVELDLSGQLTDTLSIWFAYAYVDAKTSNEVINADWGVSIPAGSRLINIPEHSGSLTLNQQLTLGGRPAAIGAGINYVGDRLGETITPSYELPSYTLVRLFGSYEMTDRVKFTVNVDNVLDEDHYQSSYHRLWTMPGPPITYKVGVQYSF